MTRNPRCPCCLAVDRLRAGCILSLGRFHAMARAPVAAGAMLLQKTRPTFAQRSVLPPATQAQTAVQRAPSKIRRLYARRRASKGREALAKMWHVIRTSVAKCATARFALLSHTPRRKVERDGRLRKVVTTDLILDAVNLKASCHYSTP